MQQLIESAFEQVSLRTVIDVGITALLIYWLFSLIRGTQAVRLVIGVTVLILVYAVAQAAGLRLLRQVLESVAVVGLFALVVVFQPELRRALDRIGRVGSFAWLYSGAEAQAIERVAGEVARAAAALSRDGYGALVVFERETGLEEIGESGVRIDGDVTSELLQTIFARGTSLHDGAVIVRGEKILAAGALLPLAETTLHTERFGTRHRAALGITESTDAVVVVVSEENGQISLVERARIVRNLNEQQLARAIRALLDPTGGRGRPFGRFTLAGGAGRPGPGGRAPALAELARLVGRPAPAAPPVTPPRRAERSGEDEAAAARAPR